MGVQYQRAPNTSQYGYGAQAPTYRQNASNLPPYINNTNHVGYSYGKEVGAPTKVSVGTDWATAPTTYHDC